MSTTTHEALHTYITDMIALEDLLAKSVAAQAKAHEDHAEAAAFLRHVEATVDQHIEQLKQLADTHDAGLLHGIGDAIKRGGSMLAGIGASAIDLVRTEKLAKNLRDDVTAFSLATTGYYMLYTTATALGETGVANTARLFMSDYAKLLTRMHDLIPDAVLAVLRDDELPVVESAVSNAKSTYRAVWAEADA